MDKLSISNEYTRDILIYSFRYALGRATYAVGTMIQVLEDNIHTFTDSDLELYRREIMEAVEHKMCIDCKVWLRLADKLQDELDKRRTL